MSEENVEVVRPALETFAAGLQASGFPAAGIQASTLPFPSFGSAAVGKHLRYSGSPVETALGEGSASGPAR